MNWGTLRAYQRPLGGESVFAVFTPTAPATVNFVPRHSINDALVDALQTPGQQLIIYGQSGSGKSTLVQRKLEELYESHITTRCSRSSTFASLLLDAFDQLNQYYVDSERSSASSSVKASLAQDIIGLSAALEGQRSSIREATAKRAVSPQLTIQRLASGLGMERMCWVIEDAHKVPEHEKVSLAQAFKVFSDMGSEYADVKIIAIGATGTPTEVVECDPDVRHRVAEISVPLMTEDELKAIIFKGESLLNVRIMDSLGTIPKFSTGLASICHHVCLNMCLEQGVQATSLELVRLGEGELRKAVARYVEESSGAVKVAFDRALRRNRVRRYDNSRLILSALADAPLRGLLKSELLSAVRVVQADYPQSNLTLYLRELITANRGSLIRHDPDGRYRFLDPIHHAYAQGLFWPDRTLSTDVPELRPVYSTVLSSVSASISRWGSLRRRSGRWPDDPASPGS